MYSQIKEAGETPNWLRVVRDYKSGVPPRGDRVDCRLNMEAAIWRLRGTREISKSAGPWSMCGATGNGLVEVDISVPDLDVEAAFGVGADPGFVMNSSSLAPVI